MKTDFFSGKESDIHLSTDFLELQRCKDLSEEGKKASFQLMISLIPTISVILFCKVQDAPEVQNIITRSPVWPFLWVIVESCFWVSDVKRITSEIKLGCLSLS